MAGIYHNETEGLISLSGDGENWITIADKNLGATQVWNSGDELSEANAGKYYQWGNNYGFPFTGSVTTSSTQVNPQDYGPGNYYSSSTFITQSQRTYSWMYPYNANLWGDTTGTDDARRGPCDNGFHVPSKDDFTQLDNIGIAIGAREASSSDIFGELLKIPKADVRWNDGLIYSQGVNGQLWTSTPNSNNAVRYYFYNSNGHSSQNGYGPVMALSIRPFKNEAVIPYADEGRTKLYGDDLPPRPTPPVPVKKLKWLMNKGNFYYFDEAPTHASSVILNESSITLTEAGQTYQLTATVSPDDAVIKKVHWSSSDLTVATVTQTGLVTCVTPGECTITATCDGVSATCDIINIVDIYIEFLLVGGGGGGGSSYYDLYGGGGGAGGVIQCNDYLLSSGDYNITIGGGGANNSNGGNSSFGSLVAYGGGAGGCGGCAGCNGGSGGGTGRCYQSSGCGCSGQGHNGGYSYQQYRGGGGGGAGTKGYDFCCYTPAYRLCCNGYGGSGICSSISGTNKRYAAGGGAGGQEYCSCCGGYYIGLGGVGGGGDGGCPIFVCEHCHGYDATTCGSGGGGGGNLNGTYPGGCGCPGIFILRYPTTCGYNVTGGCKYTCGDYTIHCFTSNGTLTVS